MIINSFPKRSIAVLIVCWEPRCWVKVVLSTYLIEFMMNSYVSGLSETPKYLQLNAKRKTIAAFYLFNQYDYLVIQVEQREGFIN